jgi:hypothetical protein
MAQRTKNVEEKRTITESQTHVALSYGSIFKFVVQ